MYTGGLAERPLNGAVVGPTFACLLAKQFQNLRRADRFWYENDIPPSQFTKDQLDEIRKVSLARILCDNGDSTDFVQPLSMVASDAYLNAFQYCSTKIIPSVDLTKWKTDAPRLQVPLELLKDSMSRAKRQVRNIREAERKVLASNLGVASAKSPQARHLSFLRPKRQARILSNQSLVLELASSGVVKTLLQQGRDREFGRSYKLEIQDLIQSLPQLDLSDIIDNAVAGSSRAFLSKCEESTLPCDHTSPFRTINGYKTTTYIWH